LAGEQVDVGKGIITLDLSSFWTLETVCRQAAQTGDKRELLRLPRRKPNLLIDHEDLPDDRKSMRRILATLADYIDGKYDRKRGQRAESQVDEEGKRIREAANVVGRCQRYLIKHGWTDRDPHLQESIKAALKYMEDKGTPVDENRLRNFVGRGSKKKKKTRPLKAAR
jgi:hypothetical protein